MPRRLESYSLKKQIQQETNRRKREQKLRRQMLVIGIIVLLLIGFAVDRIMDSKTMGCRISVYGQRISWMTVEKAADKIEKCFEETKVVFEEQGENVYETTLGAAGYRLNRDVLLSELQELKESRHPCFGLFERWKSCTIAYEVEVDPEKKSSVFAAANMNRDGQNREESSDAFIDYLSSENKFIIVSDWQGNEIDQTRLTGKINDILKESFQQDLLQKKIVVPIDQAVYVEPKVSDAQSELVAKRDELNSLLSNYPKSSVTYTFGSVQEVLSSETVAGWMQIGQDSVTLDENAMQVYIAELAEKYNTKYISRTFRSSLGYDVQIDNNEYGYLIDQNAELAQLKQDLMTGTEVVRDPIYASEGYQRDGNDDLMGTYIEVSITNQYLWLYKDWEEVLETPVVTGQPKSFALPNGETSSWETLHGAFQIAYKQSPSVLSSDIYGYETEVQYWMPFAVGQGLHDADWRSSFGGNIYLTNGSHGCINLPPDYASSVYYSIEAGYPILIYE